MRAAVVLALVVGFGRNAAHPAVERARVLVREIDRQVHRRARAMLGDPACGIGKKTPADPAAATARQDMQVVEQHAVLGADIAHHADEPTGHAVGFGDLGEAARRIPCRHPRGPHAATLLDDAVFEEGIRKDAAIGVAPAAHMQVGEKRPVVGPHGAHRESHVSSGRAAGPVRCRPPAAWAAGCGGRRAGSP